MLKAKQVPDEVVEAALEAFAHASGLGILPDDEYDEEWREDLQNGMRAACIAMLKSWPGMLDSWSVFEEERQIILPLPQENGNE